MSRPRVLIAHPSPPQICVKQLAEKCEVIRCSPYPGPTMEEIYEKVPGVDAIILWPRVIADKKLLDLAGPKLKTICTLSAGVNTIDLEECRLRGIIVTNMQNIQNNAVANMAIMLMLAASRRMQECRQHIEQGTWIFNAEWMTGLDLEGSTVGIVGLGKIGQTVIKRLKAFEVQRFLYSGRGRKQEGDVLGAEFVSFNYLLKNSDFVIVTCALSAETLGLFNDKAFNQMKRTCVFVNVARGEIVDQPALIRALETGKIWAAGLDVMYPEPLPTDSKLLSLHNCVLMPHKGSSTVKTREDIGILATRNVLLALEGKPVITPV